MKIWTLNDELIDQIVDEYCDYVTNSLSIHRQTIEWRLKSFGKQELKPEERALRYDRTFKARMEYGEETTPATVINLPMPQKQKIRAHFISLIHQIYLCHFNKESGAIVLNSGIMQKLYRHYNYMLDSLCHSLIIMRTRESVGDFARSVYYIQNEEKFKYKECKNQIVIGDLAKVSEEFNAIHMKEIEKAKKLTSSKFIDNYNKSLKLYKMKDVVAAQQFINNNKDLSDNSKRYYRHKVELITNKKIKEIEKADDNGRIYHIVTLTPKLLRKYTNIKYIIDTKNSHPLLFNYFILEYYFNRNNIDINNSIVSNINSSLYITISNFIINNINKDVKNYYYFSKELCKLLNINGFKKEIIDIVRGIKSDVWEYIFQTSQGKLWDEINIAYPQFTRSEIKVEMFRSLFYSYATKIKKEKVHAKAFQKKYPQVTRIIQFYKKTYHSQCKNQDMKVFKRGHEKDKIQLAHKLMQLESSLFCTILTRLYKDKTFKGVGIHDAIAVFDDSSISCDNVRKIMGEVYYEVGLCPTFSVEESDADCETIYIDSNVE